MAVKLNIVQAQLNMMVGDIDGNVARIIATAKEARDKFAADIIVFPELALCGYPPEDLLLRPSLAIRIDQALQQLKTVQGIDIIFGAPVHTEQGLQNQALVLRDGEVVAQYAKQMLPNYGVFDEKRYFVSGEETVVYDCKGVSVGLLVCEDLWFDAPAKQLKAAGAEVIISINASPYHINKPSLRQQVIKERCSDVALPILYVNQIGGQDELIFDGGSFAVNNDGELAYTAPYFEEGLYPVVFDQASGAFEQNSVAASPSLYEKVYQSLVLGVRDYVNKNGFKGVVLGLSGGIDSALTLAVAVDALGKDRVQAVMMPFRYTSEISLADAEEEATILGVDYKVLPIEPMFDAFMQTLNTEFAGYPRDTTEENLQARCRGVMLMAISNKKGYLVLTTGNKSEMSVGYATLYGDMAGGFDVLKDIPKVLVFKLSEYRNTLGYVIPQRVIDRPPSAELAPDQVDADSLPPYDVLDRILELYVEKDYSAEAIVAEGLERDTVYRILRLVDINEYKRRQAAIGVRITSKGFGRDRRYPITNGWRIGI